MPADPLLALVLIGFALAGIAGWWAVLPPFVLLLGFAWLPGAVGLAPCRTACRKQRRVCPLEGPGRLALESAFALLILLPGVLPEFLLGTELARARLPLAVLYLLLGAAGLFLSRRGRLAGAQAQADGGPVRDRAAGPAGDRAGGRARDRAGGPARDRAGGQGCWLVAMLAVLVLLPAVHIYAGGTVDDWWDLAFIRAYAERAQLSFAEPILGSGTVHPRFLWNAWLVLQALILDFSGQDPAALQAGVLALFVTVLSVSGVALLAGAVFEPESKAARVGSLLFMPLWLYGTEALPYFTRLEQDKFVAALVYLPAMIAAGLYALRSPGPRNLVLVFVACAALVSVHGFVFAVGLIGLAACLLAERSAASGRPVTGWLRRRGPLVLAVALPALYPLWQVLALRPLFALQGIRLSATDNPVVRAHLWLGRILWENSPAYIINPAALFGPIALIAVAGWLLAVRGRRSPACLRLFWLTLLPCLLLFVPFVTALAGRLLVPWMLYRIGWLVPVPLLAGLLVERLWNLGPPARILGLAVLATLSVALAAPVAAGRFRRGMLEHPRQQEKQPRGTTLEMYRFLAGAPPPGAVLAPPGLSSLLPALSGRAAVAISERGTLVFSGNEKQSYRRLRDRATFFAARTRPRRRRRIARSWDAAYAVFRRRLVTRGSENQWLDRATAQGFFLAVEGDGMATWALSKDHLQARLPRRWPIVFANADFFVVRLSGSRRNPRRARPPAAPAAAAALPDPRASWIEGFAVDNSAVVPAGELLASMNAYPAAGVRLEPVPIGLGVSDRLVWTGGGLLWQGGPSELIIGLRLAQPCEVSAVEIVPFLKRERREVLEVRVAGGRRRRLEAADGRHLFVPLVPAERDHVVVRIRSMLGLAFGLDDVRLWGRRESCTGGWRPVGPADRYEQQLTLLDLLSLARHYPHNAGSVAGLASRVVQNGGDEADARALLRLGLMEDRRDANAWVELGLLRDEAGQADRALAAYEQAKYVDSNNAWARGCLAWAEWRRKAPLAALYHAWRASRLDPRYADAYTILAKVLSSAGFRHSAEWLLLHAIELDPRRNWAYLDYAQLLAAQGRRQAAVELLKQFLDLSPNDAEVRTMLAHLGSEEWAGGS